MQAKNTYCNFKNPSKNFLSKACVLAVNSVNDRQVSFSLSIRNFLSFQNILAR